MTIVLLISSLCFVLLYQVYRQGWGDIEPTYGEEHQHLFSVIVPVRNEAENIQNMLNDLAKQTYAKEQFEVIVVDDHSDDDTASQVEAFIAQATIHIKLLKNEGSGKKYALTKGIAAASHPIIVTTDADCRLGQDWLKSYDHGFDKEVKMVVGPVLLKGEGFFAQLQTIEYAGLNAFGALTLSRNIPTMCSGANLAFKKEVFDKVGGYRDNIHIPSGDDEFLLYKVLVAYPGAVKFLKNEKAIAITDTHATFSGFMSQRKRWTSKWKYHNYPAFKTYLVLYFIDTLIMITALAMMLVGWMRWELVLLITLLRGLAVFRYITPLAHFFRFRKYFIATQILQILYPFYLLFMGLNSIFGSYKWKGRAFHDRH